MGKNGSGKSTFAKVGGAYVSAIWNCGTNRHVLILNAIYFIGPSLSIKFSFSLFNII